MPEWAGYADSRRFNRFPQRWDSKMEHDIQDGEVPEWVGYADARRLNRFPQRWDFKMEHGYH